jgi:hypothetical protein
MSAQSPGKNSIGFAKIISFLAAVSLVVGCQPGIVESQILTSPTETPVPACVVRMFNYPLVYYRKIQSA